MTQRTRPQQRPLENSPPSSSASSHQTKAAKALSSWVKNLQWQRFHHLPGLTVAVQCYSPSKDVSRAAWVAQGMKVTGLASSFMQWIMFKGHVFSGYLTKKALYKAAESYRLVPVSITATYEPSSSQEAASRTFHTQEGALVGRQQLKCLILSHPRVLDTYKISWPCKQSSWEKGKWYIAIPFPKRITGKTINAFWKFKWVWEMLFVSHFQNGHFTPLIQGWSTQIHIHPCHRY